MAELYNVATQAYQQGRQRAQEKRLNELAQLAMANPDALPGLGAQMAGIDASAGLQLSGAIQERQLADQQRQRTRAAGFARYLQRIKDPNQRAQIAQIYGPKIGELPQDLSDQGLGAFIAASGQSMPTTGLTPSMQTLLAQRDLGLIDDQGLQTAVNVLNRTEAGAAAPSYRPETRWNPQTQREETVYVQTSGYQPGVGGPAAGMFPPQAGMVPPQAGVVAPQASFGIDAQMQEIGRKAQEMERSGVRPDVVQGFINAEMDRLGLSRAQGQAFSVTGQTAPQTGFSLPTSAAAPRSASFGELAAQAGNVAAAQEQGRTNVQLATAPAQAAAAANLERVKELARGEAGRENDRIANRNGMIVALNQADQSTAAMQELIDTSIAPMINNWTTGTFGSFLAGIGGTNAANLESNLDTLKAVAGFSELTALKARGGTLGAVSEMELQMLTSLWGALRNSQSPEAFRLNLDRYMKRVQQSWQNIANEYELRYGESAQGAVDRFRNPQGSSESPAAPAGFRLIRTTPIGGN